MSIAQAGLAFRPATPIDDLPAVVRRLFDDRATEVASPGLREFDTREPANVMVQVFGDACFVCSAALADTLLDADDAPARRVHRALGAPPVLMAFRHDDADDRYGYAVFDRGERRRLRLQAAGAPAVESGEPLPFERRWLGAEHFVDPQQASGRTYYLGRREVLVPERRLTGRLLQDGLEAHFDVCPWETLITPSFRFFRLDDAAPASTPADDGVAPKRRWWQRLGR